MEVLELGVMSSALIKLKGPNLVKRKYPTQFPLKHAQKDMRFALALGDQVGFWWRHHGRGGVRTDSQA